MHVIDKHLGSTEKRNYFSWAISLIELDVLQNRYLEFTLVELFL